MDWQLIGILTVGAGIITALIVGVNLLFDMASKKHVH